MRFADPVKHGMTMATPPKERDWSWIDYPTPASPEKPIHPDGDQALRMKPRVKADNSERIIHHMQRSGNLRVTTGDVEPSYTYGHVEGVPFMEARQGDRQYTITKWPSGRSLHVQTNVASSYGAKVRIGNHMVAQGYPLSPHSDNKVHVYDPIDGTITEIQNLVKVERNWFLSFIYRLFGAGDSYRCDGVTQYSVNVPSTDESVRGRSAALTPKAESEVTPAQLAAGWRQRLSMGVPAAHYKDVEYPARRSDGPSRDADAVRMGQALKLTDEALEEFSADAGPQLQGVLECLHEYGVMVDDTGGTVGLNLTPHPDWDQSDVGRLTGLELTDFEVWCY